MKFVKFFLLGLGIVILTMTVKAVGFHQITAHIAELKWKLLPLLFIYPFIFAFDTAGWSFAFPKSLPKNIPFHDLCRIRIIGETLNAVIPWAASLGGEPIKAELLKSRHGVSLSEGYASILIVHTTFWISLNIFVVSGILLTFQTLPLTPLLKESVLVFTIVLALVAILLVIGLHLGIFKQVHSLGETFKWWGEKSDAQKLKFLKLDDEIKKFYTHDKRRFFFSIFFNFLGWFTGTFEVYWIAKILDMPIGFTDAWLLEALIQVLRIATFFIPSSIGAQEGGIMVIFSQIGFANASGLTFAIVRRLREIIWIGFGLLLWSMIEDRPKIKTAAGPPAG